MIEVRYEHEKTTKTWERFRPVTVVRVANGTPLELTKDIIIGQIYLPLGTSKEGFRVTIEK